MEEHTIDALIELYLSGTISPGDKARLEQAMAADPAVAELVHDSKRAYKALLLERNRLLKEKLKKLDLEDLPEQKVGPRRWRLLFVGTGILVLLFLILHLYHSPLYVARSQFLAYPLKHADAIPGASPEAIGWEEASSMFYQRDFEKAIQRFLVLAGEQDTPIHFEARWNILMAQLADDGPTASWLMAMDAYAHQAPHSFSSKARNLSTRFSTMYYNVFFSPWKEKFSSIKPRLI